MNQTVSRGYLSMPMKSTESRIFNYKPEEILFFVLLVLFPVFHHWATVVLFTVYSGFYVLSSRNSQSIQLIALGHFLPLKIQLFDFYYNHNGYIR